MAPGKLGRHARFLAYEHLKKADNLCPFCDREVPENLDPRSQRRYRANCKDPECIRLMMRFSQQRRRQRLYDLGLTPTGTKRKTRPHR